MASGPLGEQVWEFVGESCGCRLQLPGSAAAGTVGAGALLGAEGPRTPGMRRRAVVRFRDPTMPSDQSFPEDHT